MRADRSLIPGLGAAVSLVAAVACAFFVTAAVVAFHRWPQVASTSDARAVVVAGDRGHARAIVAPRAPARASARTSTASHAPTAGRAPITATVVQSPRQRAIRTVVPEVRPTAPTGGSTQQQRLTIPPAATNVPSGSLAGTAQTTASNVGGLVNGLTNGVASTVAPVSPSLADTVTNLGDTVSGTVISVGNNLAELLLGLAPSQ